MARGPSTYRGRLDYDLAMRPRCLVLAFALLVSAACRGSIPPPPDVAAPPPDSLKTTSGLSIKMLQKGTGTRHPGPDDRVTVHYTGWQTNGTMFDSSVAKGRPATFRVTEVIAGWTEALQRMVEGEKVRVWIPEELAYQGGEPSGMLVFDIELIQIE